MKTKLCSILTILLIPSSLLALEVVNVDVKRKPYDKEWTSRETRILEPEDSSGAACCESLDQFGGKIGTGFNKTGFFHMEKDGDAWVLVDPEGNPFISTGINSVRMGNTDGSLNVFQKKFGSEKNWANQTGKDLKAAGFNTIGSWSDWELLRKADNRVPYTIMWDFMSDYGRSIGGVHQESGHVGYPNNCPFIFNKGFEEFCNEHAKQLIELKDDPYLIGHYSDNEMPLKLEMLDRYLGLDKSEEGYQATVKWLKKKDVKPSAITDEVRGEFLEYVAEEYFEIVNRAIKKYDPNHMYIGCRFHGSALRLEPLFKAAADHLDILSINWYNAWSPDERMDQWKSWVDIPFIITEFYAKGMDSGMGNTSGAGWTVKTQRERGYFYQNFTLGLLEHPNCVGWHWHRYMDNDPNAGEDPSNVDSNKGLVSCEYVPHEKMLTVMADLNFQVHELRKQFTCTDDCSGSTENSDLSYLPFGYGGQVKMLYDARQRPQAIYLDNKLHLVFSGGAKPGAKPRVKTKSMAVTFDPLTQEFSKIVTFPKESSDHHDGPVIWADMKDRLHVFYDWHNTLGKHLISNQPGTIGTSPDDWSKAPTPAPKMAYPWMSRIYDNKQLVFYRTDGHYSSWSYRITSDDGKTWDGPENDVTDLDIRLGMDTDWSIYTSKAVSKDGNYLHLGFVSYDDYKRPRSPEELASGKLDPRRMENPLYDNRRTSNYKENLYYVRIDLRNHEVTNYKGEVIQTPIDLSTANTKCMIWDTKRRGGGIVPTMIIDNNDQVGFLHNISDVRHEESLSYHYVRLVDGKWKHTRITDSNHHWNSGHLRKDKNGVLHAYVLTGEGYLESDGEMDRYGGGDIEEWISRDDGNNWRKARDLNPDASLYQDWKFNNIQPVKRPDGSLVDGMLLFYGWKAEDAAEAKAFLLLDSTF